MLNFTPNAKPGPLFKIEMERIKSLGLDVERIYRGVSPEAVAGENAPILDRWLLGIRTVPCLVGLSTGHPRLVGEDRLITTSDLWLMSQDMRWARTLSRWYALGRPGDPSDLDA